MIFDYSANEKIYYTITGSGKTQLLFLHGFGASHKTWDYISDSFDKEKFTLIVIDLLGHGNSSINNSSDYSILSQTSIVFDFIKFLNLKELIIIGHSYGGSVALMLTILHMKNINIKKLVLIDAGAYNQIPVSMKYLRNPFMQLITSFANVVVPKHLVGYFVLRNLYFDKTLVTRERIAKYSIFFSHKQLKAIIKAAQNILPGNFDELIIRYRDIEVPALIIWGKNDLVISPLSGEKLNSDLKNSSLGIIENCGHIPQEEKPKEIFELINDFLLEV